MVVKAADLEAELIGGVCARVRERMPSDQAAPCEAFVRQYYHWVAAADLADRSRPDLYGAAIAHWNLFRQRAAGEVKVHVYNPDYERDGWQSPHTVVEIVGDDMPFLVDSVTMELGRQGYGIDLVIHPVIRVRRNASGDLVEVIAPGADSPGALSESVLHAEVERESDPAELANLQRNLGRVLGEVSRAVADWQAMRAQTDALIEELARQPSPVDPDEIEETRRFLGWLAADHFTFLGYREYELVEHEDETGLKAVPSSGLGILRRAPVTPYTKLSPTALELARAPHALVLTKANSRSTVHRPSYLDYIGVKRFGEDGQVTGECRFLGLYTTATYKASPREIPLLRGKVEHVLDRAGFPPDSHDTKALIEILETYPRDSLFQIDAGDLFEAAIGILGLGERQRLRLFLRQDPLGRFIECLVCLPRDRFNTENRERVARILVEALMGTHVDWTVHLSESLLARIHYIVHCSDGDDAAAYDVSEIEARLVRAIRAWTDDLREALIEEHGEERGRVIYKRFAQAFPPAYRADWPARSAVGDIERLQELVSIEQPIMRLYQPLESQEGMVRCKLFSIGGVSLSDVLPTFEHMGAKVVDERPYEITPSGRDPVWIYDFGLRGMPDDLERVRDLFQQAFLSAWRGELEDDGLNGLVLGAALTGREITIIRAVAKYLRQAGIAFSDAYMERTLTSQPEIAALLVRLFVARLDPDRRDSGAAEQLAAQIEAAIDEVQSLDEDRILRAFLTVLLAVLRTNYFRAGADGAPRAFLSFKLDPALIPLVPEPKPRFEIFVYSPRFEGVHLRGGGVARGGLRWSDRREDFRTEILGLMKAQMVKNALIVPVGAKGGFVLKRPPRGGRSDTGGDALREEAIRCFRMFLSGLLDLTDNIAAGEVVPPDRVVRYDPDDPYLVVAADKGTATFSDIANEVSAEYGFWLGDAFASGGSRGYDHKAMGITARGAWVSVQRHFRELGTDIQSADFTVAGIGDMAGDVFGNGMLLSSRIKLVAAFNHLHIFLDPDPDPDTSFAERRRLFELKGSSWQDYDRSRISAGGGIFARSAKSIRISAQVQAALEIEADELVPAELIRAILRAPVDLHWNGGIGTYVKASSETHAEAGDKANDALRVDGRELRCRVVGEGGNLGFTQRGRIEYALGGGAIDTDAIDNAAGVNCSDHEVNIKILLGPLVDDAELSEAQRNDLLREMTDAVAEQVLDASYTQTQALSIALAQAAPMVDVHGRLIRHLEQVARLKRRLEFLPSDKAVGERRAAHQGLVSPELAVLMAYVKIHLYSTLLESDLPEDPYLAQDLRRYFPPPLPERFSERMGSHRLRREIVATVVANQLVDRAGTTFAFRLGEETGAPVPMLARGYAVAREVFQMGSFWSAVEQLDNRVEAQTQLEMLIDGRRLVERATRWLVRAHPRAIDVEASARRFRPGAELLAGALPEVLEGVDRQNYDRRLEMLRQAGVPDALARRVAGMPSLLWAFDIVEIATGQHDPAAVMTAYFRLGSQLELDQLRDRILELPRASRWQALARAALRDDLYRLHRALTQEVLDSAGTGVDAEAAIASWRQANSDAIERCLGILADIRASRTYDVVTLSVAIREVRNLINLGPGAG